LDINLLPKVGSQWLPKGQQVEVMTPGTNAKRSLAGALNLSTGTITHGVWYRKQTGLFLDLLDTLARSHPVPLFTHLTVVVDNAKSHKAQKVQKSPAVVGGSSPLRAPLLTDLLPARQSHCTSVWRCP
jgi:hypothetical protein